MTEQFHLPWPEERRLIAAVAAAADYYRDTLFAAAGSGPRHYLTDRGVGHVLDRDSIWRVGYAPAGRDTVVQHLRSAGYTDEEAISAGLVTRSRRGTLIGLFRDRVVVPIRDHLDGHVIAFTARAAPGATSGVPKYINTPTTALDSKSDVLLGLYEQRRALESGARPVLVEGTFDVLTVAAPSRNGDLAAVSACGTRVSPCQLAKLVATAASRDLVLAFDGDSAGRTATHRTLELATATGIRASAILLPTGVDPATVSPTRRGTRLACRLSA